MSRRLPSQKAAPHLCPHIRGLRFPCHRPSCPAVTTRAGAGRLWTASTPRYEASYGGSASHPTILSYEQVYSFNSPALCLASPTVGAQVQLGPVGRQAARYLRPAVSRLHCNEGGRGLGCSSTRRAEGQRGTGREKKAETQRVSTQRPQTLCQGIGLVQVRTRTCAVIATTSKAGPRRPGSALIPRSLTMLVANVKAAT